MTIDILDGGQARQARVVVRDRGQWRCNPGDAARLGQGIHRMTRLVDTATIHRGGYDNEHGTEVILLSIPIPINETDSSQRGPAPEMVRAFTQQTEAAELGSVGERPALTGQRGCHFH